MVMMTMMMMMKAHIFFTCVYTDRVLLVGEIKLEKDELLE